MEENVRKPEDLEKKAEEEISPTKKELLCCITSSIGAAFIPSVWAAHYQIGIENYSTLEEISLFSGYWICGTTLGVVFGFARNLIAQQYELWEDQYKKNKQNGK
jgi:hypothetical protein